MTGWLTVSLLEILLEGILEGGCNDGDQAHLLMTSVEVDEREEGGRTNVAKRERRYRLARIAQIEAALALAANGHGEDEDNEQHEASNGEALSEPAAGKRAKVDAQPDYRHFCADCAILPVRRLSMTVLYENGTSQ